MIKVVINGARLTNEMDGMRRSEVEIIKRLDKMLDSEIAELIVKDKKAVSSIMNLKNIRVVECKYPKKHWEFFNVDLRSLITGAVSVGFCNRAGYARKGLYLLNDIIPITFYGEQRKKVLNANDIISIAGYKYYNNLSRILKHSKPIITISEFCKNEFVQYLGVREENIAVAKSGWEHILDIGLDAKIFKKYPNLSIGNYYFSLGSVSPHKNFKLIYDLAKKNPNEYFVVTGGMLHGFNIDISNMQNMIYTGRLTDEEMKALMCNCKAFIFPSLIEGLGLPPLEALACGVQVCVSDIPVMHEFCKKSVHYFDPYNSDLDLNALLKEPVEDSQDVLNELSWDKCANVWYSLIMDAIKK